MLKRILMVSAVLGSACCAMDIEVEETSSSDLSGVVYLEDILLPSHYVVGEGQQTQDIEVEMKDPQPTGRTARRKLFF